MVHILGCSKMAGKSLHTRLREKWQLRVDHQAVDASKRQQRTAAKIKDLHPPKDARSAHRRRKRRPRNDKEQQKDIVFFLFLRVRLYFLTLVCGAVSREMVTLSFPAEIAQLLLPCHLCVIFFFFIALFITFVLSIISLFFHCFTVLLLIAFFSHSLSSPSAVNVSQRTLPCPEPGKEVERCACCFGTCSVIFFCYNCFHPLRTGSFSAVPV